VAQGDTHFDTVIVGSGFGGSVSAYRLAAGGQRVCVLERGKAYPPGSFARTPGEMRKAWWDPSRGLHGLWNIWSFTGLEAMVSAGLGGGSLVYANVLLRKDERWFVKESPLPDGSYEHWPIDRADLEPHYDNVEKMMNAQKVPFETPGYDFAKTRAMQEAAAKLGHEWFLPNLAVTFANDGRPPVKGEPIPEGDYPNIHGLTRLTCRARGECDFGCNEGAKNTLDHNYLSAAKHKGADIRTRSEVRRIAPLDGGGFSIEYVEHTEENEGTPVTVGELPHIRLTADRLILAAGALGTPFLLLRNRTSFPNLGDKLGSRFSGNGDLMTFVMRTRTPDGKVRQLDPSRGPVITSAMRVPDAADDGGEGRGFYIEDAGYPEFVGWLLESAQVPDTARRFAQFAKDTIWKRLRHRPDTDVGAELASLIGEAGLSVGSMPLLGMGRDVPDGQMRLQDSLLEIDWSTDTSKAYFDRVRNAMKDIATELGGDFKDNVLWRFSRVVTVHALGGAPMARHEGEGVVSEFGEAFNYPGLFVLDGSAMPGPVGPNPALTIAAFADRAVERMLEQPAPAGVTKEHL
jgi:cholesterol oxidase